MLASYQSSTHFLRVDGATDNRPEVLVQYISTPQKKKEEKRRKKEEKKRKKEKKVLFLQLLTATFRTGHTYNAALLGVIGSSSKEEKTDSRPIFGQREMA